MTEAVEKGAFRLGRGGFFIRLAEGHPRAGENVSFRIGFRDGGVLAIEGSGITRWVRREHVGDLAGGCGIEFECLRPETRAKILELNAHLKTRAFIPWR